MYIKRVKCYTRDLIPLVSETIFRDGNGGKSKSLKVGVRGPSAAAGGVQRQRPRTAVGVRGLRPLKLTAFSKSKV